MASSSGMSSGSFATIERRKRIAVPSQGTCSEVPSQEARSSVIRSGVRVSETRVAIRSPTARPRGDSGPTSSTTPIEHPAGPGDRVLHLAAAGDDPGDLGPHARSVPEVLVVQLPEARGVEVEPAHPDPHLVRADLRRCVQAPGSLGQHARRARELGARPRRVQCGDPWSSSVRPQPIHRRDTKILRLRCWPCNDSFRYAG